MSYIPSLAWGRKPVQGLSSTLASLWNGSNSGSTARCRCRPSPGLARKIDPATVTVGTTDHGGESLSPSSCPTSQYIRRTPTGKHYCTPDSPWVPPDYAVWSGIGWLLDTQVQLVGLTGFCLERPSGSTPNGTRHYMGWQICTVTNTVCLVARPPEYFFESQAFPSAWGWLWVCEKQRWPYLPYNWTGHCCCWLPFHWLSKLQNLPISGQMTVLNILGILFLILWLLLSVLNLWHLVAMPPTCLTLAVLLGEDQDVRVVQGMWGWRVWSGWLLSCSLYIACLTSARFTHTCSNDCPSYVLVPGPSWWQLIRGAWGACPSTGFPGS